MAQQQYQLKVMLSTSIPDNSGYIELTSDILNYSPVDGKIKKLAKYPFFHPTIDYPRKEIQDLEYHKRLEVFFNYEKFKSFVLKNIGQTEKSESSVIQKNNVLEEEEDFGNKLEEEKILTNKKNSNFEFTIQTLLCTGFPVNNYFQSMEYYDPSIRTKSITLKGSSWFPFLPGRFDRNFSYLKLSDKIYTVSGVVWINDALSHPKYLPVIESYAKYNDEKKPSIIAKKESEVRERREIDMNLFLLNIYRDNLNQSTTIWRPENLAELQKKQTRTGLSDKERTSYDIRVSFQEDILAKMNDAPEINNMFETLTVDTSSDEGTVKYSSVDKIKTNIFYLRGEIDSNHTDELNTINQIRNENKAYFYWKQIYNSLYYPESSPSLKAELRDETNNTGIFSTGASNSGLEKAFRKAVYKNRKILYTNIYDTYRKPQTFRTPKELDIKDADNYLHYFLEDYNLSKLYKIELDKKQNKEMYWLYKTLIENYTDIKKRLEVLEKDKDKIESSRVEDKTEADKKIKAYKFIVDLMQCFIDTSLDEKDNFNQNVKESIEIFLGKFTDEQFKMLSSVNYGDELRLFIKKMRNHDIEIRAYEYVVTNTDYSDDKNKIEIDKIVTEKFKHFNVFTASLKELATSRKVSNPFWKIEADKFVGVKKGKIALAKKNNQRDIFEVLSSCREYTSKCKDTLAAEYLYTELDELKSKNTSDNQETIIFEAFIQTNVIKGKITKDNYKNLKCTYLNYSLGAMYQKMRKKMVENYIVKNRVYFDLEKEILNAEKETKIIAQNSNTENVTKKNNLKEGGRKSYKKRNNKNNIFNFSRRKNLKLS